MTWKLTFTYKTRCRAGILMPIAQKPEAKAIELPHLSYLTDKCVVFHASPSVDSPVPLCRASVGLFLRHNQPRGR
jgi:hypothetical protein